MKTITLIFLILFSISNSVFCISDSLKKDSLKIIELESKVNANNNQTLLIKEKNDGRFEIISWLMPLLVVVIIGTLGLNLFVISKSQIKEEVGNQVDKSIDLKNSKVKENLKNSLEKVKIIMEEAEKIRNDSATILQEIEVAKVEMMKTKEEVGEMKLQAEVIIDSLNVALNQVRKRK